MTSDGNTSTQRAQVTLKHKGYTETLFLLQHADVNVLRCHCAANSDINIKCFYSTEVLVSPKSWYIVVKFEDDT